MSGPSSDPDSACKSYIKELINITGDAELDVNKIKLSSKDNSERNKLDNQGCQNMLYEFYNALKDTLRVYKRGEIDHLKALQDVKEQQKFMEQYAEMLCKVSQVADKIDLAQIGQK